MTRKGIEYNLSITPYIFVDGEFYAYFSSAKYLEKFQSYIKEFTQITDDFLSRKYGVNFHSVILSQIVLYSKTETRGFRICYRGVIYECLSIIKLNGVLLTEQK